MELSRVRFLGAGTALAAFGTTLLTPFIASAAQAGHEDIKQLNGAIALERAGIKAYQDAIATGFLSGGVLDVAKRFMSDHTAHRDALLAAVKAAGQVPTAETTKITYPNLTNQTDILQFAETVEKGAATAYLAAIPLFKDRNLAKVAASILGVETTHVTTLAAALNEAAPYKAFIA